MQIYPDILGGDAVKDSRQMLLDRDDSLKTNFSGPTPPEVTYDDLGCMWFNTTDRQFYGLVDINEDGTNATWQKIANISKLNLMDLGTPTTETLYVDLVGQDCETKEDMMVLLEHTILPTENYEITEMGRRVTFVSPIPANLKLELRWFSKTIIGRDGATFVPKVENGVLSWDNDQELPNPEPLDFNEVEASVTAEGVKQVGLVSAEGTSQISKIQNSFDDEKEEKIEEFNTNATEKTSAFNTNVVNKTDSFNENAANKTTDFNDNAEIEISKAKTWATGDDENVGKLEAGEHSSRVYANFSNAYANTDEDVPIDESDLLATDVIKGDPGKAATINVGTVTIVAPGETPTIVNSGTENDAILDFELPGGVPGKDGVTPTISIGEVVTGEAGSQASVTNTGTSTAAEFNFVIPKGDKGEKGEKGDSALPAGVIMPYMGTVIPDGWLVCNGQNVSRTQYARLFAAIGTVYGEGDGETTFTLPNLLDRYIRGSETSGQYIEAGLPDFDAGFRSFDRGSSAADSASGAAQRTSTWSASVSSGGSDNWGSYIHVKPSNYNSIYGNSETVTPKTLTAIYIIKD